MFNSEVKIGNSLCLNALRGINHEQRPFAGSNGARNFIRKIYMSGGINEVEDIFPIVLLIIHLNSMTFYGNASFSFQIHIVQHLSLGIALRHSSCELQ